MSLNCSWSFFPSWKVIWHFNLKLVINITRNCAAETELNGCYRWDFFNSSFILIFLIHEYYYLSVQIQKKTLMYISSIHTQLVVEFTWMHYLQRLFVELGTLFPTFLINLPLHKNPVRKPNWLQKACLQKWMLKHDSSFLMLPSLDLKTTLWKRLWKSKFSNLISYQP